MARREQLLAPAHRCCQHSLLHQFTHFACKPRRVRFCAAGGTSLCAPYQRAFLRVEEIAGPLVGYDSVLQAPLRGVWIVPLQA